MGAVSTPGKPFRGQQRERHSKASRAAEGPRPAPSRSGGKLDEVFVRNWNRLARNLREFLNVLGELQKLGLKVTCINQPTENTPTGKLLCHVMGAFAEFDHAQILQNTRNGFTKKAERGGYNGGSIRFGIRVEGQGKNAGKVLDTRALSGLKLSGPDVVVKMMHMAADQKKSGPEIARALEALGVSSPKGRAGLITPSATASETRSTRGSIDTACDPG